jgi:3-phosphoglycerate kinase
VPTFDQPDQRTPTVLLCHFYFDISRGSVKSTVDILKKDKEIVWNGMVKE